MTGHNPQHPQTTTEHSLHYVAAPMLQLLGCPMLDNTTTEMLAPKAWLLLAYLSITSRPQPRPVLCALLWPESQSKAAHKNLSNIKWEIRQAFSFDPFQGKSMLSLAPTLRVDIKELRECRTTLLAQRADQPLDTTLVRYAESILPLYRGSLLQELQLTAAPEAEQWLATARTTIEQEFLEVLQRLTQHYQQLDMSDRVIDIGQRMLDIDPFHEQALQVVLGAYVKYGRRAEALRTYQLFTERLQSELGLEPLPETQALYTLLLDTTATSSAPSTPAEGVGIPVPTTPCFGRSADLRSVQQHIAAGARLITISGPGGIGKTRFLAELTTLIAAQYQRVIYLACSAILDGPALDLALLHALSQRPDSSPAQSQQLVSLLSAQPTLLVLDNLEQIAKAAAPLLQHLVERIPTLLICASSRQHLNTASETVLTLKPLATPPATPALTPEQLQQYPTVQWLLNRISATSASQPQQPAEWAAIQAICAQLQGVPLALELAAAWTTVFPLPELAKRLAQPLPLLQATYHDRPAHQQSMRATLDWSYSLLTQPEQALVTALAIFPDSWTISATTALLYSPEWSETQILLTVRDLLAKSWIYSQPDQAGLPRLSMLAIVREYLQASADQQSAMLHARYVNYYTELVAAGQETAHDYTLFEAERTHIYTALRWLIQQGEFDRAAQLCINLTQFWFVRGYLSEGRHWWQQLLDHAENLSTHLRAQSYRSAGILAYGQSELAEARRLYQLSLEIYRTLEQPPGIAGLLSNLGLLELHYGQLATAQQLLSEALVIWRQLDVQAEIANTLNTLAIVATESGAPQTAIDLYTESLQLWRSLQRDLGAASVLNNLGELLYYQQNYQQAQQYLTEALALWQQLDNVSQVPLTLYNLGLVALAQHDSARARELICAGIQQKYVIGDAYSLAIGLEALATVCAEQRQDHGAVQLFAAAERIRQQLSTPRANIDAQRYAAVQAELRQRLAPSAFAAAWQQGQATPLATLLQPFGISAQAAAGGYQFPPDTPPVG